jgi:hypothetical protein
VRYRKKPVEIEALLFDGSMVSADHIEQWSDGAAIPVWWKSDEDDQIAIEIKTLEGTMIGAPGDYIIKGLKGEFYPCKPDIFAESYEAVT